MTLIEFTLTVYQVTIVLGFSLGFLLGESFSDFDKQIKHGGQKGEPSDWYKKLTPFQQWLVSSLLDLLHHYQYGLAIILISETWMTPGTWQLIIKYIGIGLVISDGKDFKNILKRMGLNE